MSEEEQAPKEAEVAKEPVEQPKLELEKEVVQIVPKGEEE